MGNYDMSNKVFIWANSDMDGACSTILLGNIFPNMVYKSVFFGDFLSQYESWSDIDDYDAVFVVGMVLDQSLINKIDDHKVIFISDRAEKLNVFDSKLICEETTSCSKLIYKKFKEKFEIPADLKKLILYVDGYNSYTLKHKESEYLNGIYRNTRYNRFNAFVKRWWNGYGGLTDKEQQSAQDFFNRIEEEYARLDKFEGKFKNWTVLATFSKLPVNEIAKKLIDNGEHDVIVVVNTDTQFVSFRKRPESTADLAFIAENLCNGGGSSSASGGKISQKFLDFTTKLEQI